MRTVVLVEITFEGTDLWDPDGSMAFWFTKGAPAEPPTLRGEDDVVAARSGRSSYPRVADVLPIGIAGMIHAPIGDEGSAALAAAEARRRQLLALFTRTTPGTLAARLPDGATATIEALVLPPVLVREVIPGLYYELDVALESVDPAWVITPAGS